MINTGRTTYSGCTQSSQYVARAAGGTREVGSSVRFQKDRLRDHRKFLKFDVPHCANDLFIVGF